MTESTENSRLFYNGIFIAGYKINYHILLVSIATRKIFIFIRVPLDGNKYRILEKKNP